MRHKLLLAQGLLLLLGLGLPPEALCQDGGTAPPWLGALARGLHGPVKAVTTLASLASLLTMLAAAGLGILALALLSQASAPEEVERIRRTLETRPRSSLALGWANLLLTLLALNVLLRLLKGPGVLLALLLLAFVLTRWFRGLAAVGRSLGRKLWDSCRGPAPSEVHELVTGLLCLIATTFLPFVGWIFFLWTAVEGLGASLLLRFGGHRTAQAAAVDGVEAGAEEEDA